MPRYAIEFLPSADRQLQRFPTEVQRRIVRAVETLVDESRPPAAVKLAGAENIWRIRAGQYRVLYEIHGKRLLVLVVRVRHRKDIYRKG